ncbi:glutamate racemase [Bacteroidia bacterium]|nr:glutamate racemase [Bacteroidia bacterium]
MRVYNSGMKIGVFDSGLGGLIIMCALAERLPQYDFAYFGDTANLPYGSRSGDIIYKNSVRVMDYLFGSADCAIVIVACNTASAAALRKLQQEYLPAKYPDRRILGVVVPTVQAIAGQGLDRVGLIATASTVRSNVYSEELAKVCATQVISVAAPLIVPLVENGGDKYAREIISDYLAQFDGLGIQALILGCTHYPFYKDLFAKISGVPIISQDDIIPESLADYLARHPEINVLLSRDGARSFAVSDQNLGYIAQARRIFGNDIELEQVRFHEISFGKH